MAITQATVRNDQLELQRRGFINVNLTALTTTAVPDVEVGSAFEVGGSIYEIDTADETPAGWAAISNDTQAYIYFDASAETLNFTTTSPSYSAAKGGWYSGDDRYLARVYKDASGNADKKQVYNQQSEADFFFPAGLYVAGHVPFSTVEKLTSGTSWTVPESVYTVRAIIIGAGGGGGGIFSDGASGGPTEFNGVFALGGAGGLTPGTSNGRPARHGFVSSNGGGAAISQSINEYPTEGMGAEIEVRVFNVTPGDSISYSIGAGGSGGGGAQAGGAGGDGVVIVAY